MTETYAEPQRPPRTRKSLIFRLYEYGWYFFPAMLLAAGYFVPALRLPMTAWPIPEAYSAQLPWALLIMTAAAVVWIIADFFVVSYQYTSTNSLRANTAISTLLALVLTFYAGWFLKEVTWGYLIPWVAAVIDAFISADRSINNAAQKPIVHGRAA